MAIAGIKFLVGESKMIELFSPGQFCFEKARRLLVEVVRATTGKKVEGHPERTIWRRPEKAVLVFQLILYGPSINDVMLVQEDLLRIFLALIRDVANGLLSCVRKKENITLIELNTIPGFLI